jgi:hypothetical protein
MKRVARLEAPSKYSGIGKAGCIDNYVEIGKAGSKEQTCKDWHDWQH